MNRAKAVAVGAFLLIIVACDASSTSPLISVDGGLVDARGDAAVSAEILGDALNPFSIQSDGLGIYYNGTSGVVSIIQSVGDWELDLTGRRATRKVRLDLSDSLPGNPSAAPFSVATVPARFISKATELNGRFQGMVGLGSTILSPLSVGQIAHGSKTYAIRMNRNNHPATDWALVTCIGVATTNSCNKWRLTPAGNHGGVMKNVARLEEVGSENVFIGLFYFSFDIVVTR